MTEYQKDIEAYLKKQGFADDVARAAALKDSQPGLSWFYRTGMAEAAAKRLSSELA